MADKIPTAVVIEDDRDLAEMYRLTLRQAGFETLSLTSGGEALEWLRGNSPGLVLLDLNLPEVSGLQLIDYIHNEAHLRAVKIIVVTANPEMAETIRNLVDLVLIKPTSLTQIRDLARRLVTQA